MTRAPCRRRIRLPRASAGAARLGDAWLVSMPKEPQLPLVRPGKAKPSRRSPRAIIPSWPSPSRRMPWPSRAHRRSSSGRMRARASGARRAAVRGSRSRLPAPRSRPSTKRARSPSFRSRTARSRRAAPRVDGARVHVVPHARRSFADRARARLMGRRHRRRESQGRSTRERACERDSSRGRCRRHCRRFRRRLGAGRRPRERRAGRGTRRPRRFARSRSPSRGTSSIRAADAKFAPGIALGLGVTQRSRSPVTAIASRGSIVAAGDQSGAASRERSRS